MATRSFTHSLAAGAAVVAVALRIASIFLWPPNSDAAHRLMLASAAAHPGQWAAATVTEALAWVLAAPAVFACVGLVRGRGVALTRVGGWFWGVSLLALGFLGWGLNTVTGALAAQHDLDGMLKVLDSINGSGALLPMVFLVLLGMPAFVVFTAGLARAGIFRWWVVGLSAFAIVAYMATQDSSNHLLVLVSFLPIAAIWVMQALVLVGRPLAAPTPAASPEPQLVTSGA